MILILEDDRTVLIMSYDTHLKKRILLNTIQVGERTQI